MALSGVIVFASGSSTDFDIWSLNLETGGLTQLTRGKHYNDFPRWSPDGQRIAYVRTEDDMIPSLWTMSAHGTDQVRLTRDAYVQHPCWSPDGKEILFTSNHGKGEEMDVCRISAQGGGVPQQLFHRPGVESQPSWSPDGETIVFSVAETTKAGISSRNSDIWEYQIASGRFTKLTSHPAQDDGPVYSPDGRQIAFISHRNEISESDYQSLVSRIRERAAAGDIQAVDESIRNIRKLEADGDVYVMNRDGSGVRAVTRNSMSESGLCWSPCGKYLMFTKSAGSGTNRLTVVEAATGDKVPFDYDRRPLEGELNAGSSVNTSFFQLLIPDFVERRFADRSFWGEERHPHWKA